MNLFRPWTMVAARAFQFCASFASILGLPVVLMGFTPPDENAHAPNEWMDLNNYETSIRAIARVFDELVDLPR